MSLSYFRPNAWFISSLLLPSSRIISYPDLGLKRFSIEWSKSKTTTSFSGVSQFSTAAILKTEKTLGTRWTKTKVITLANHNRTGQFNEPIRTWRKYMHSAPCAGKRVLASHNFSFDWLMKWREIFYPITKRIIEKPKHSRNYFRH